MPRITMHSGDLLGFSGHAWSSAFINLATYGCPFWSLSHVAIVGAHEGKLLAFESDECPIHPCAIRKIHTRGVQAHVIDQKIETYPGKVWHYPISRRLYPFEIHRLNQFLHRHIGTGYDDIGAVRAGGLGFSWIESWLREENLSSLFCSEYCAAAHREVGLFPTDNVGRWSPNRLVRKERRMGLLLKPRRLK
jgi:hypothetical protein